MSIIERSNCFSKQMQSKMRQIKRRWRKKKLERTKRCFVSDFCYILWFLVILFVSHKD